MRYRYLIVALCCIAAFMELALMQASAKAYMDAAGYSQRQQDRILAY